MTAIETTPVSPGTSPEPRPGGRTPRRKRIGLAVGFVIVAIYVVVAAAADWIAPYDPLALNIPNALATPSGDHPLGTDHLGRDVLSRMIVGTRIDLTLGIAAAGSAFVIGTLLGLISGYSKGWVDVVITRVMDVLQALPGIVLLIVFLLIFGSSAVGIVAAMALTGWVAYARLVRGEVMVVRDQDYAVAARLAGFSHARTLSRHVLPNVWVQAFVFMTSDIVLSIGVIAALGYLGIGIPAPAPEWGQMIFDGQPYLASHWWLSVSPGFAIIVLGLGLALISDAFTDQVGSVR